MINRNYAGLFDEDEIECALVVVRKLQACLSSLEREDPQDLFHRCLAHWYFKKEKYEPERLVKRRTFMSTVLEHFLIDIAKHNDRTKRREDYFSVSLDAFSDMGFDGDLDSEFDMDEPTCLAVEDENFDEALKADLKRLLTRAKKKLSKRQQELCRLFQDEGLSMRDVSKKMNIPRATLFDEILRIREVFRQEGLKDYL